MLSVIFFILKMIGFILLFLLLLIALILLVPIRYQFAVNKPEGEKLSGSAKVSWFAFLFSIKVVYLNEKMEYAIRILGRQIRGNQESFVQRQEEKERKKREKARRAAEKKAKKDKKAQKKEEKKEKVQQKAAEDRPLELEKEEKQLPKVIEIEKEELPQEIAEKVEEQPQEAVEEEKKEKKPKRKRRAKKEKKKTKSSLGIVERGKELINVVKSKWEEYNMGENLPFVKNIVVRLIRHVLPTRLKGHVIAGFDNPEWTGYLTAGAAFLYPVYGKSFSFTPDFVEPHFAADCHGRGRIRLGFLVYIAIKVFMNKEIRTIILG